MTMCASCGNELSPTWKFCIRCGTPTGVVTIPAAIRSTPTSSPNQPGASAPPLYPPSPFRDALIDEPTPDPDDVDLFVDAPTRHDIPLAIGIGIGISGLALVVYIAIALSGSAGG